MILDARSWRRGRRRRRADCCAARENGDRRLQGYRGAGGDSEPRRFPEVQVAETTFRVITSTMRL